MNITRDMMKALRVEIDAALKDVAAKHDIVLKAGNIAYRGTSATIKLELTSKNEAGELITKEAESFLNSAFAFGLQHTDLGRRFMSQGKEFTIVGAKPRSPKYPILGADKDDRVFKFPAQTVIRGLI